MAQCPRCNVEVSELHNVDSDVLQRLQGMGGDVPPPQVCAPCRSELRKKAASASGGVLLAQERAKDQRKLEMWKNRVQLVRNARQLMAQKSFAEAAVSYEKYLRILEVVFNLKKGTELTPEHFKDNARTSELTVVATVYWDLLRIYDTSSHYTDRQKIAAKQLAIFLRFTPVFPDIIRKAESFAKSAKHPDVVKSFLKNAAIQRPRCFIATATYSDPLCWEVQYLRFVRDEYIRKYVIGRFFIGQYYRFSPKIAELIEIHPRIRWFFKVFIDFLVRTFAYFNSIRRIR